MAALAHHHCADGEMDGCAAAGVRGITETAGGFWSPPSFTLGAIEDVG